MPKKARYTPPPGTFRALMRHFDPKDIMNPGGTLALDLPPEERATAALKKVVRGYASLPANG